MTGKPPLELDLARVLACAEAIIARVERHGVSGDAIAAKIEEVLFSRKDAWAAACRGLITEEETATLLLAHVDELVRNVCGTEAMESDDVSAMKRALFGDR